MDNVDPATLTDEELDKAIAGEGAEDTAPEVEDNDEQTTPEEPEVTHEADDTAEQTEAETASEAENELSEETETEETQKETAQPSRREAKRIQSLINKLKQAEQPIQQQESNQIGINYRDMINAEDETYEQLEKASQEYGTQQRQQGTQEALAQLQSVEWRTNLKIETPQVLSRHPELDPENPSFNASLADALNQEYIHTVGFDEKTGLVRNPSIGYLEYIEARYELAEMLASEKAEATTKNVKRQASQTGLRPDGSQAKRLNLNKAPQNMTDEELDTILARGGLTTK